MRTILVRSISGICFIAIMVLGLILNEYLYAALLSFMIISMMAEFYKMTMGKNYRFSRVLGIISGEFFFLLTFSVGAFNLPISLLAFFFLPLIIVMSNSLYVKERDQFGEFAYLYTGILYIAVPLALSSFLVFRHGQPFNGLIMLCFFIIIWSMDVGAYVAGSFLGQKYGKKLYPEISPRKSWIGFWGGMFMGILASLMLGWVGWFEFHWLHCILLGMVMSIAGTYGDLFESQWKRHFDVKDSGSIIPGHGGMMDRFDSALFAIPAGVIYMMIFSLL